MTQSSPCRIAAVLAFPTDGAHPLDDLAGLTLVARCVLALQKAGIEEVLLLHSAENNEIAARVQGDPRVRVRVVPIPCSDRTEALELLPKRSNEPILIAAVEDVVDPGIYGALRRADPGNLLGVAAWGGEEPAGPFVASFPAELATFAVDGSDLPRRLVVAGKLAALDIRPRWHAHAGTPEGRNRASFELFEACRKPMDGMISRNINRHISILVSKRLVSTGVTPNQISILTFLLGIAGAWSVAQGGYFWSLLGAFLFQWNSILDGCDGELARVRYQHSKLGQWLDTVFDDVSNVLFYGGLAIGAAAHSQVRIFVPCGIVAMAATLLTMAQYYTELVRLGSGDFYAIQWGIDKAPRGVVAKIVALFERVLKKDFFIFLFLCMAVAGVLPWALPVAAFGATIAFGAATVRNLRRLGRRPNPAA